MSTENVNNSQNQMENAEIKRKTVDHTFRLGSNPDQFGENDENSKNKSLEKAKTSIENQNFEGKKNTKFFLCVLFLFCIFDSLEVELDGNIVSKEIKPVECKTKKSGFFLFERF